MVSSTPRPHFTPGKDPVSIVQEAGWAPGRAENGVPTGIRSWTVQLVAQSLYRLSYPAHLITTYGGPKMPVQQLQYGNIQFSAKSKQNYTQILVCNIQAYFSVISPITTATGLQMFVLKTHTPFNNHSQLTKINYDLCLHDY